jgi:hypothetical protein
MLLYRSNLGKVGMGVVSNISLASALISILVVLPLILIVLAYLFVSIGSIILPDRYFKRAKFVSREFNGLIRYLKRKK